MKKLKLWWYFTILLLLANSVNAVERPTSAEDEDDDYYYTEETTKITEDYEEKIPVSVISKVCIITSSSAEVDDNNLLTINWTINDEDLCKNVDVNILVQKTSHGVGSDFASDVIPVTQKSYLFPNLIPCATYNYTFTGTSHNGESSFTRADDIIEAKVQYAMVEELTAESVDVSGQLLTKLSWTYKYTECYDTTFKVFVSYGKNQEILAETKEKSITLDSLPKCTDFKITVYPEGSKDVTSTVPFSTGPSEIRNFHEMTSKNSSEITFSWEHPELNSDCIKYYTFKFDSEFHSNQTNLEFFANTFKLNVYDCVDYSYELWAHFNKEVDEHMRVVKSNENVEEFGSKLFFTSAARPFDPPTPPRLINATESSLTIETVASQPTTNKCSKDFYAFFCSDGTNNFTAESTTSIATIDGLKASESYVCTARVKNNQTEWSPWSYEATLATASNTPNSPKVHINESNSTSFTVTWKEPTEPKGEIESYGVKIRFLGLAYFNPDDCPLNAIDYDGTIFPQNGLKYVYQRALPAAKYSVQVTATNGAGPGDISEPLQVITREDEARSVRNFAVTKNEDRSNKTIAVSWNYPCQANGVIEQFALEFRSSSHNFTKHVFHGDNQTEYHLAVNEMDPNLKYSIKIYAKTENTVGKSSELQNIKVDN